LAKEFSLIGAHMSLQSFIDKQISRVWYLQNKLRMIAPGYEWQRTYEQLQDAKYMLHEARLQREAERKESDKNFLNQ
jgi:hypothetical protein